MSIPFFAKHVDIAAGTFSPDATQDAAATMLDELLKWATVLKPSRG